MLVYLLHTSIYSGDKIEEKRREHHVEVKADGRSKSIGINYGTVNIYAETDISPNVSGNDIEDNEYERELTHQILQEVRTEARTYQPLVIPKMYKGSEAETYRLFVTGVLVYSPIPGDTEGQIFFPIRDLKNPLEDRFDLSLCGEIEEKLSINTGYRKKIREENNGKVEIWFVPRFVVERDLNSLWWWFFPPSPAQHLQAIMGSSWAKDVPIGIFWTWWDWQDPDRYHYSTTMQPEEIKRQDLCVHREKAEKRSGTPGAYKKTPEGPASLGKHFRIIFDSELR